MTQERRTREPFSPLAKGILAFSILIVTGFVVSLTVTEQSTYVSVEKAISGDYEEGSNLQIHGTITELRINDCFLVDENHSIKIDISSLVLPDTFAEDKGATFTGVIKMIDGELVLMAEKVQMGCPSKYEPADDVTHD